MGHYINPENISKTEFMEHYSEMMSRETWLSYRGDSIRVCLIFNGHFEALGIAYCQQEADVFASTTDPRPRIYAVVPKAAIEGADSFWVGRIDSIMR